MTTTKRQKPKKLYLKHCYISNVSPLNCSVNGNPRYEIDVTTDDGSTYHGKTGTDCSIGYSVRNYEAWTERKTVIVNGEELYKEVKHIKAYCDITYHVTRNGNIIFTYAAPAQPKEK